MIFTWRSVLASLDVLVVTIGWLVRWCGGWRVRSLRSSSSSWETCQSRYEIIASPGIGSLPVQVSDHCQSRCQIESRKKTQNEVLHLLCLVKTPLVNLLDSKYDHNNRFQLISIDPWLLYQERARLQRCVAAVPGVAAPGSEARVWQTPR